jgi:AraC-like DNA-binding protein/quercetin dioxygenase-like cupin family protein
MVNYRLVEKLFEISPEEHAALESSCVDLGLYMAENQNVVTKAKFLSAGKLIAMHRHLRFVEFPPHSHDYIELVYMIKGTTFHLINGTEIALCEGELLLIGNGASHAIRCCSINDLSVNFIIHPDFFKSLFFTDKDAPIEKFFANALTTSNLNYFHFKVANELPVQNLVENLIGISLNEARNRQTLTRATMELLFHCLVERTPELSSNTREKIVMHVLQYIDTNYVNGSLSEVALQLHCSVSWLSREIKTVTGHNFKELIQDKRMSQAVFLLTNTDMKIADISEAVGYENTSFFHRAFTRKYGVTPSKLRNRKNTNKGEEK